MIIPRFTAFLQLGEKVDAPFNTRIGPREQREVAGVHTRASTHPPRYISHRRTSLYVNCIRNSEYPANFLRADHLRISAKRTSIRRSLHHKFRRTCVTPTHGSNVALEMQKRNTRTPPPFHDVEECTLSRWLFLRKSFLERY